MTRQRDPPPSREPPRPGRTRGAARRRSARREDGGAAGAELHGAERCRAGPAAPGAGGRVQPARYRPRAPRPRARPRSGSPLIPAPSGSPQVPAPARARRGSGTAPAASATGRARSWFRPPGTASSTGEGGAGRGSAALGRGRAGAGGTWSPGVNRLRCPCRSTAGDTVELVEESLDVNLLNNAVRLRIQNCLLLPGGVHLCEVQNHLVLLIVTNQTVHRLVLPHPARMYRSVSCLSAFSFTSPGDENWAAQVQLPRVGARDLDRHDRKLSPVGWSQLDVSLGLQSRKRSCLHGQEGVAWCKFPVGKVIRLMFFLSILPEVLRSPLPLGHLFRLYICRIRPADHHLSSRLFHRNLTHGTC